MNFVNGCHTENKIEHFLMLKKICRWFYEKKNRLCDFKVTLKQHIERNYLFPIGLRKYPLITNYIKIDSVVSDKHEHTYAHDRDQQETISHLRSQ